MAQGRPPRHSKNKREPVTLDLEAEKGPEPAETETPTAAASADSSAGSASDEVKAGHSAGEIEPRDADASAVVVADDSAAAEEVRAATENPEAVVEEAPAAAGTTDGAAAEQAAAGDADAVPPPGPTGPYSAPARERPSGGGRGFAAGLLGGIVITAIAFGLLYGGVLPIPDRNTGAAEQTQASVSALEKDVAGLKQSVSALNKAPQQPDAKQAIDDLKNTMAALSDRLGKLEKQASQTNANAVSKAAVGGLNDDLKSVRTSVQDTSGKLDALSKRVDVLASKVVQAGNETALLKAVAATALNSAVARGGSFKPELQAYRSVAPDDPVGTELQKLEASGVPSRAWLLQEFPRTADAILAAVDGASDDSGVFGRLMASAQSVIKVRPTGAVKGSSPKAVVARMEVKLNEGDLNGVVKEWQDLPEAGRNASKKFIGAVKARVKAESLAAKAMKASMPATGTAGQQG